MNENAVATFRTALHAATAELDRISEHVKEDMMGVDPESVNWSHVGDAGRLVMSLKDISRWLLGPED